MRNGLTLKAFALFVLLMSSPGTLVLAETSTMEEGLKGLTSEEVIERFGPPDRKDESAEERHIWYYGRSMILFNNGKVSAWSNTGELRGRSNLSAIRDKRRSASFAADWINVWTPIDRISAHQVLQQLMSDDKESEKSEDQAVSKESKEGGKDGKAITK